MTQPFALAKNRANRSLIAVAMSKLPLRITLAGLAAASAALGCADGSLGAAGATGTPPSAGVGFEVMQPGIGTELELPYIQIVHMKQLDDDGNYALEVVASEEAYDTSPQQKPIVATSSKPPGTQVPTFSVTADMHMPYLRSLTGAPSADVKPYGVEVSRTLEFISGPRPATTSAQREVQEHMALFWTKLMENLRPWADVRSAGSNWEDVRGERDDVETVFGQVTAKRFIELGAIPAYQMPDNVYGLVMVADVVNEYNKHATPEFQLSQWKNGKDYAFVVASSDIRSAGVQASIGVTAKGYNEGHLEPNFLCQAEAPRTDLSGHVLRKNCRGEGNWDNENGVTACFDGDCFGRACYMSGVKALKAAESGALDYPLARDAAALMASLVDDEIVPAGDLSGPIGDAVKSALITLRCSTLALAQDNVGPEWKLKSMIGNLPKVTWEGFSDPDFGNVSDGVTAALEHLPDAHMKELSAFACNPNGSLDVSPQLFISAPGDAQRPIAQKKREAHCKKQLKEVLSLDQTIGGGSAFTPGRIGNEPAFVVESRLGYAPITLGFSSTEWWAWGKPQDLMFAGNLQESLKLVCSASDFDFNGERCISRSRPRKRSASPAPDDERRDGSPQKRRRGNRST